MLNWVLNMLLNIIKVKFYFSYLKKKEWDKKHERRLTHLENNFAEFLKSVKN